MSVRQCLLLAQRYLALLRCPAFLRKVTSDFGKSSIFPARPASGRVLLRPSCWPRSQRLRCVGRCVAVRYGSPRWRSGCPPLSAGNLLALRRYEPDDGLASLGALGPYCVNLGARGGLREEGALSPLRQT